MHTLGIDISKLSFSACLLDDAGRDLKPLREFPMTSAGLLKLLRWLPDAAHTRAFFEPTGVYSKPLLHALCGKLASFHQLNALTIVRFHASMTQTKTDSADAKAIAKAGFGLASLDPVLLDRTSTGWDEQRENLSLWLSEYDRVSRLVVALKNQIKTHACNPAKAAAEIAADLKAELDSRKLRLRDLKRRIRNLLDDDAALLQTIPGMGELSAAAVSAKVGGISRFQSAEALKGFLGTYPRRRQSGSYEAPSHMATHGAALVRHMLWNCAKSAARHNPVCKALYERLVAKGKKAGQAYGAVCRKLVQIIYGVLKHKTPFDASLLQNS